jgi:hypothetical protein
MRNLRKERGERREGRATLSLIDASLLPEAMA